MYGAAGAISELVGFAAGGPRACDSVRVGWVLGITEFTLSRWKRLSGFGNEVYEIAREELKGGQLAAILQAQAKVAQSEVSYATQAARFVFEAAGMLSKGPAVSVEGEKVLIVSRDGLDAGI